MESLNYYLTQMTKELFIKNKSIERSNIKSTVKTLKKRLKLHFGNKINKVIEFGSYTRGTILPRKYDENSDVDIMIFFNTNKNEVTAETYRTYLKLFAEKYYSQYVFHKDFPSVIIELKNIKFDLVPAIIKYRFFSESIRIPDSKNTWQRTDPDGFNEILTNANTQYNSIVKPIIRLLKYWNSQNGYPYDSYKLEQLIANMNFRKDNIETGFYYAIKRLQIRRNDTKIFNQKVNKLKYYKDSVVEYLQQNEKLKAKIQLNKIFNK